MVTVLREISRPSASQQEDAPRIVQKQEDPPAEVQGGAGMQQSAYLGVPSDTQGDYSQDGKNDMISGQMPDLEISDAEGGGLLRRRGGSEHGTETEDEDMVMVGRPGSNFGDS